MLLVQATVSEIYVRLPAGITVHLIVIAIHRNREAACGCNRTGRIGKSAAIGGDIICRNGAPDTIRTCVTLPSEGRAGPSSYRLKQQFEMVALPGNQDGKKPQQSQ